MVSEVTYQQDTVKIQNLLRLDSSLSKPVDLKIENSLTPVESIPIRENIHKPDSKVKTQAAGQAQIRYWNWNAEQKLLVNGSRLMEPQNHVKLVSSVAIDEKGLALPYQKRSSVNTDWLTILLFFILILFATVRNSYWKYLGHLLQSTINYSTANRMFQERNYTGFHGAFRLEVYFYLSFAVFIFQVVNYLNIKVPFASYILFVICLGAVLAYFLLKKFFYHMFGTIVEGLNETSEFLFNMDNFNRTTGLFLFPVVALIAFNPFENPDFPILLGIFAISVFYILLIQRGIAILLKKQFSIFYLFLYLCTLEILPLLLIYKIVDV